VLAFHQFFLHPRVPRHRHQIPAKANGVWSPLSANHVGAFGVLSVSQNHLAGTNEWFPGLSQTVMLGEKGDALAT
jgi:hypothetical protein